ncbi:C25 family cysteine peptidase [Thermoplasmatota archaeon]
MKCNFFKKCLSIVLILIFISTIGIPQILSIRNINNNSEFELLIICPNDFSNNLIPLVNHKVNLGLSTILVTLDEIYESQISFNGRDEAEKIKYYIKYVIEEWNTDYVLLVGGKKGQTPSWHLPVRYVNMDNNWESHFITDLYFSDIYDSKGGFSNWDSDLDGVYGEWKKGGSPVDVFIDLYPDIAVGRLPCRNNYEVKIIVEKIIEYENTAYGESWFNDFVVIAGDTYLESDNPLWVGYEGEYYGDLAIDFMDDFNPIRLYTSDGTLTDQSDVINTLNEGCGFVYFVGHGNPQSWGNHPPDDHEFITGLNVQRMHELRNDNMYPICIVSGCHNSQFDVSILNIFDQTARYRGEATFECWGWRILRKINGGSIASFGCTALGHTKEDKNSFAGGINELEVQIFKEYGENNIEYLGDLLVESWDWYLDTYPINWNASSNNELVDSWLDAQVVESYILFGDPSLKIGGYQ